MLVDHLTCPFRRGFSWIRLGLETENTTGLAYNFTRFLARLYFGRYFKLPEVVAQAEVWYGRILGLLRQDIQGDAHKQHLKLLLAVKTATLFETIRCTTPTGWIAHTRGLAEIIQHLGVTLYKSRPLNAACDLCRMFIISEAVRNRHHIFLTDPEWLESARPQDMCYPESTVFDILTYIPGLLTDIERANSPSTRGLPTADILDFRTLDILQKLFAWRWAWEDHLGSTVYEQVTDASIGITVDEQGRPLWPTMLAFEEQLHATHISYYNAGLMMILKIARNRLGEQWRERVNTAPPADLLRPFRPSPLIIPDELQTATGATQGFCRTFEYQLSFQKTIAVDSFRLLLALQLAYEAVEKTSMEAAWMRRTTDKIADMTGFELFQRDCLMLDDVEKSHIPEPYTRQLVTLS